MRTMYVLKRGRQYYRADAAGQWVNSIYAATLYARASRWSACGLRHTTLSGERVVKVLVKVKEAK